MTPMLRVSFQERFLPELFHMPGKSMWRPVRRIVFSYVYGLIMLQRIYGVYSGKDIHRPLFSVHYFLVFWHQTALKSTFLHSQPGIMQKKHNLILSEEH